MRNEHPKAPRAALASAAWNFAERMLRGTAPGVAMAIALGLAAPAAVSPALAQSPAIVKPGYAVVTGFAGVISLPAPDGADPFDYLTINTEGNSARVVDLTQLGPQGALSTPDKPFSVSASQVGQVFGVTLDNAPQPNIYLAAASVYGLAIYVADETGQLKRVPKGEPGAQFVPGQFGPPELGGGPGSIWRADGVTGEVSLLVTIDGGAGSVAGLGALAFDPVSQQIFVSERGTGIIYRLGLDGTVKGTYDHGVEGRPNAGLSPLPMGGFLPVNVESPVFDTGNPKTWGFAPPARRVFAIGVFNRRLYYSVAQGPQIWSAGIGASGAIPGSDARLEVEVPSLGDGIEISSITFDGQGRMYLAERGATKGDYYLYQLAADGESRVLRYVPKPAGDPNPGRWKLDPDLYAIGMPPIYNNAAGGVALNFGYGQTGKINFGACGATVWSTGDRLLDPGDGSTPDAYPQVEGLQGNLASLVEPQNMPPMQAWFVDYDDQAGDASLRGYLGAIATIPCAAAPKAPPVVCPQGTYFSNGQCFIIPKCPQGTTYKNGQCVYPNCPPGFVREQGVCVPPPQTCPQGTAYFDGQCVPVECPPGLLRLPNGFCACPQNEIYVNGQCEPLQQCKPPYVQIGDVCVCPLGLLGGDCNPPKQCNDDEILTIEGQCEPLNCPIGQVAKNHQCVPITCGPNKDLYKGACVPKCNPGFVHFPPNGVCKKPLVVDPGVIDILCLIGQEKYNGVCVPKCDPGFIHFPPNGVCKKPLVIDPGVIDILCLVGQEKYNGVCVPKCNPGFVHFPPNGVCKKPLVIDPGVIDILCLVGQEKYNGVCVPKCDPGFIHFPPNGACKKPLVINPGLKINPGVLQLLPVCDPPNEIVNDQCVPPCEPPLTRADDGTCQLQIKNLLPGLQIQPLQP